MSEDIQTGLLLMVVGVVTVFIVLLIVIGLGNLLIRFVNRYVPEELTVSTTPASAQTVPPHVSKVVAAVVAQITQGKGIVSNIEKK